MNNTAPLLNAEQGAVGEKNWRGRLVAQGSEAELVLRPDGSFTLTQDPKTSSGWLSWCFPPVKISASTTEVVGARLTESNTSAVQILYMPLHSSSHSEKPTRRVLLYTPPLTLDSPIQAQGIVSSIQSTLYSHISVNVLVIINPASGKGSAPTVFSKLVQPILAAAGAKIHAHTTTSRGHATRIVQEYNARTIDLILSLGGDGTMFEVLQGVLHRTDWKDMCHIPLVQVPCGSGNALAASTGLWDVSTAVHAALRGQTSHLDITSVVQVPGKRFFSFLSFTYGMLSCLDIGTEHLRFLGSTRFVLGALHQIIKQPTFTVHVAYLEADNAVTTTTSPNKDENYTNNNQSVTAWSNPALNTLMMGHQLRAICSQGQWSRVMSELSYGPELLHFKEFLSAVGAQPPPSTSEPIYNHDSTEDGGTEGRNTHSDNPNSTDNKQGLLAPHWSWCTATEVQLFGICNLPRLDMNFLFAPHAAADNGHLNFLYTAGKIGRKKGLELLSASEKGQHMHLVEQKAVRAFWMDPRSEESTWVVVDGEAMPHSPLYAEVHPGLCTVMIPP